MNLRNDWSDSAGTHCGDCGALLPTHQPFCCRKPPHAVFHGPAFDTTSRESQPTLRQRYAMAALTGLCANQTFKPSSNEAVWTAFRLADAMLAAERETRT